MRDTSYATEQATAHLILNPTNEAKIERIFVKETNEEEIRFSWWKDGRMMLRPLDLAEGDLLQLLGNAIRAEVFTPEFRSKLRELL